MTILLFFMILYISLLSSDSSGKCMWKHHRFHSRISLDSVAVTSQYLISEEVAFWSWLPSVLLILFPAGMVGSWQGQEGKERKAVCDPEACDFWGKMFPMGPSWLNSKICMHVKITWIHLSKQIIIFEIQMWNTSFCICLQHI